MLRRLATMRGLTGLTCTEAIGRGATNQTVITIKLSSQIKATRVAKVVCPKSQSSSKTRAKTSQTRLSIISNSNSCSSCLTARKTPPRITIGILVCKISTPTTRASSTIANSRSNQTSNSTTVMLLAKISNNSRAVIKKITNITIRKLMAEV